ncbi:hypothetical protein LZ30DRAFT_803570 [Colletotrichum cereale]|nr:hypothetical protein LZ30DRAFT_803570 [Colletotrichum cereale]
MTTTQNPALDGKEPQRIKGVGKYLQPQEAYTFLAPVSGKHYNAQLGNTMLVDSRIPRSGHAIQPQTVNNSYTLLGQSLQIIPEGLAVAGFSKANVAAQGLTMPLNTSKKPIPAHLANSFILADTGPMDGYRLYPEPGHHAADSPQQILSESVKQLAPFIPAAAHDAAALKAVTKHDSGADTKGEHGKTSAARSSGTSDTANASDASAASSESQQDAQEDTGEASAEDDSGQEPSDGDSSDSESSDDDSSDSESSDNSSNEEDDGIPGLARVRALTLAPAVVFRNVHNRPRWPCNQCNKHWSRRDETRRHLRKVHYAALYAGDVPLQKGLEQARIDCP